MVKKNEQVQSQRKPLTIKQRNRLNGYLFLLPNIIGFLIFILVPVIVSFGMGFVEWNGFGSPTFIGLDNYARLMQDDNFKISFMNSIVFMVLTVPLTLFLALVVAVWLNAGIKFLKVFRTAIFLPYVTSTIAIAVVWQLIFNPSKGPVNMFLHNLGIENLPGWFASSSWALVAVSIVYIWNSVGYYMVLYLAGLQGVPDHLYEAAEIDGASRLQRILHITLPGMKSVIVILLIMNLGHILESGFEPQYLLGNGMNVDYSENLDIFVLKYGMNMGNYGLATAAGMFKTVVSFIFLMVANNVAKRLGESRLY